MNKETLKPKRNTVLSVRTVERVKDDVDRVAVAKQLTRNDYLEQIIKSAIRRDSRRLAAEAV